VARGVPIQELYRAALPFIVLYVVMIAVFALLPGLITFLPSLM